MRYFADKRERKRVRRGSRRAWLTEVGSGVLASVGGYLAVGRAGDRGTA